LSRSWIELLRPQPGDVLNTDDLHRVTFRAVGHHVVFVHYQFTGSGYPAWSTQSGECKQQLCFFLDFRGERTGLRGVVLSNISGNLIQIFKRLARPVKLHAQCPYLAYTARISSAVANSP